MCGRAVLIVSAAHEVAEVLQATALCLGGEVHQFNPDAASSEFSALAAIRGLLGAQHYHATLFDGGDSHPHLTVAVEGLFDFSLDMHPQSRWNWLQSQFGAVPWLTTGVPAIDDRYVVTGQPRSMVAAVLAEDDLLASLSRIEPFLRLHVEHGFVRTTYDTGEPQDWTTERVCQLVQDMLGLAARWAADKSSAAAPMPHDHEIPK
jgi:hypothetical protein